MKKVLKLGIIGDYDPSKTSHPATIEAINHASDQLSLKASISWIPTLSLLSEEGQKELLQYDGFWAGSGSPYRSMEGAIKGIQTARKLNRPFIGT